MPGSYISGMGIEAAAHPSIPCFLVPPRASVELGSSGSNKPSINPSTMAVSGFKEKPDDRFSALARLITANAWWIKPARASHERRDHAQVGLYGWVVAGGAEAVATIHGPWT